jgi:hypothetical protein
MSNLIAPLSPMPSIPVGPNHPGSFGFNRHQHVHTGIDSKKLSLYIGEEPKSEDGALIEYCEEEPGDYAKDFFKRWEETKQMMLEFNIKGNKDETLFCLKGLWGNNEWKSLTVEGTSRISIV